MTLAGTAPIPPPPGPAPAPALRPNQIWSPLSAIPRSESPRNGQAEIALCESPRGLERPFRNGGCLAISGRGPCQQRSGPKSGPPMTAYHPEADVSGRVAERLSLTQLGHTRGFESNGCLRPETVIHWDHAQGPLADQKADIRADCCGAERSLRRLRQLWDLEAEEIGRLRFRRLLTLSGSRRRWGPN